MGQGTILTVLMAVRNGGPFLNVAIDSILNQTYRNFRFLIVDDESTDDTLKIVRAYDDDRIDLLTLERNVGQTAALNIGLSQASTAWIARMDADDFSAPTRLEEQMKALDSNPAIGFLGTFAWTFHDDPGAPDGEIINPIEHDQIKHDLLKGSPLIHSSMLASRAALLEVGAYNERYRYAADIDLYDRLIGKYTAGNLPLKLYGIRQHSGQGTNSTAAMREIIDILSQRLSKYEYSSKDKAIVKSAFARANVVLARRLGGQFRPFIMFGQLWRALRASPKTFAWYFPAVFVGYAMPVVARKKFKQMLAKSAYVAKSGVHEFRFGNRPGDSPSV